MHNDPELNGKYLGTITRDFIRIVDTIAEASYLIRKRKISEYPIFPICKESQPIGSLLIERNEMRTEWNYFASFLGEFCERQLVEMDKIDDFKRVYKNPDEFCCLFVIDREFTNFVFVPYPNDDDAI
jgi:hypothetical protein